MTPVHCDYLRDLRFILATQLAANGFHVGASDDVEAVLVRFLNVRQRRVEPNRRVVKWSSELTAREPSLADSVRKVLTEIERASIAGEDLNPYLSRTLVRDKKSGSKDRQFNDWAIKHMHLGDVFEAPGVVKGTDELLFVIHDDGALYFIDVGDHKSWADDRLFLVVESNWPELFADAFLPGVSTDTSDGFVSGPTTSEGRSTLRRAGITVATVGATGRVYAPIGSGQMTDGTNFNVAMDTDRILNC